MGLTGHVVFQHLHQARFPNARLARQHHHLAHARLDPRPALPQEPHFRRPAHQRGQAAGRSHLQATLHPTGSQHAIHSQGLRQPAERLLPQRLTGEIARDELIRRRGDHQRIGRRQVLVAAPQYWASPPAPGARDVPPPRHRQPRRGPYARPAAPPPAPRGAARSWAVSGSRASSMPRPVQTARWASSSCATG